MKLNIPKFAGSVAVCLLAGAIGSFFTASSVSTWYPELNKPFFNPPGWIFGPVWTVLYILMGISLYLVWDKGIKSKKSKIAVSIFGAQLALNSLWSIVFFGLKSIFWAMIEIAILWLAIILTIKYFYKISKTSAYLLIPYILWVSFAAILTFSIYFIN